MDMTACWPQYIILLEKAIQRKGLTSVLNFLLGEASLSPVAKEETGKSAKVTENVSLYVLNIRNGTGIPSA